MITIKTVDDLRTREPGLIRLTQNNFCEIRDLHCNRYISQILDFVDLLNLTLWFNGETEQPILYLSNGDNLISDKLNINTIEGAINIVAMLECMYIYQKKLNDATYLVARLEEKLSEYKNTLQAEATATDSPDDAAEFECYLELFKKKKPEFEAEGVELTINTKDRKVYYRVASQSRKPRGYDISQSGYRKATDALRKLKKLRNH